MQPSAESSPLAFAAANAARIAASALGQPVKIGRETVLAFAGGEDSSDVPGDEGGSETQTTMRLRFPSATNREDFHGQLLMYRGAEWAVTGSSLSGGMCMLSLANGSSA